MSWKQVTLLEAARSNGKNLVDLCDRKIEEDKTDSMLWLDFNKILKILIGDENQYIFGSQNFQEFSFDTIEGWFQ